VGYELEINELVQLEEQLEYENEGSDVPQVPSQCTLWCNFQWGMHTSSAWWCMYV